MDKLCKFDIRVEVRSREWMTVRNMNVLMPIVKGSCNPPLFLEVSYCGDHPSEKPIILIGE